MTPFYDVAGGWADRTGFGDVSTRYVQNATDFFLADLFPVQEIQNNDGSKTEVIWPGIRWGWTTDRAPNQPPRGTANTVTIPANTAYVFAPADFGFTDPLDSPPNNFQSVEITTLPTAGTLTDNGVPVTAGQFVNVSDLNAGLLDFTPATNATGSPYDSFAFQVQDDGGTANGGVDTDPTPKTMTVNVMSSSFVNHAPIGTSNTVTTLENTGYTFSVADFGFSDPNDSPANKLRAVKITTLPSAGTLTDDGLAVSAGQFVPVSDINDGLLVLTPAIDSGGTAYTNFTFQVQDDGGTFNSGANTDPTPRTMTVNVTMVNQPPSGTDNTVTTLENTPYTFSAADFGFSDPDNSPANNFYAVKVMTVPSFGTLTDNGVAVSEGDSVSISDINAGLLVFTPDANLSGTPYAGFLFQVQDDGGTANGGLDTDPSPKTLMFNVTWVNQSPAGTSKTVTTPANVGYVFAPADFGFTDPNDNPPNNFLAVKITTLPAAGTLTDNGVAVSAGAFVSVSDISAGKLVFTPASNAVASPYTSFTFQVQDDGGTSNGGVDTGPSPKTMTINVSLDQTTITLTSSLSTSTYGQMVTFTATVAPAAGYPSGTPTGKVDFYSDGVYIGSGTLSNGVATFSISTLSIGTHNISAVYEGDSLYEGVTADPLTHFVVENGGS